MKTNQIALVALTALLCVTLFSCASAKKRFEQGLDLEQEGQYVEAAKRYIQSLQRDPDQPVARERLEAVGPEAVSMLLAEATAYTETHTPVEAADVYYELDALVADAAGVGVDLGLPDDYMSQRETALAKAVDALMAAGQAAEDAHCGFSERGGWELIQIETCARLAGCTCR